MKDYRTRSAFFILEMGPKSCVSMLPVFPLYFNQSLVVMQTRPPWTSTVRGPGQDHKNIGPPWKIPVSCFGPWSKISPAWSIIMPWQFILLSYEQKCVFRQPYLDAILNNASTKQDLRRVLLLYERGHIGPHLCQISCFYPEVNNCFTYLPDYLWARGSSAI